MLECQAEGIALAKRKGKYKGRKPTASIKSQGAGPWVEQARISRQLGSGITSIYRVVKTNQAKGIQNELRCSTYIRVTTYDGY